MRGPLVRSDYYGPPPHPTPSTDDASIPRTRTDSGQWEWCGMVPVFTMNRSISPASSFAPAASPRLRRRLSPWPPHRHTKSATESTRTTDGLCTTTRPISTRFEPVPRLRSFTTDSSRMPSDLARRTRPVWQFRAVPALSALLSALPGVSRVRLRSAPHQPAATARRGGLAPPSIHRASRRTSASWRTHALRLTRLHLQRHPDRGGDRHLAPRHRPRAIRSDLTANSQASAKSVASAVCAVASRFARKAATFAVA